MHSKPGLKALTTGLAAVLTLVAAVLTGVAPVGAATSATPDCATPWGSLEETHSATGGGTTQLIDVRAGTHPCFDRLVLDLDGSAPGYYHVGYVDLVLRDGSGDPLHLDGGAFIAVRVGASAYDPNTGDVTFEPDDGDDVAAVDGYPTFRQAAFGGSFEGQSLIGLGVRARLPFRTFVLDDGQGSARLVVDVAHRW